MESWVKYNFFKRKIVEYLNFMHSLDELMAEIPCTQGVNIRPKETFTHHRNSVILYGRKRETETKCLRIVYADMKKALARNS